MPDDFPGWPFDKLDHAGIECKRIYVRSNSNDYWEIEGGHGFSGEDFPILVELESTVCFTSGEGLPSTFRKMFDHGNVIVAPFCFPPRETVVRSSDRIHGLLVCWGSQRRRLSGQDGVTITEVSQVIARYAFVVVNSNELIWHRQAQRTFASTSQRILGDAMWRDDSPKNVPELQSLSAEVAIDFLFRGMQLSRCGVLLPMRHAPHCWSFVAQQGFPKSILDTNDYYVRGHGLTGLTLEAKRGKVIVSDDVVSDPRWSNRGNELVNNKSMAFVGVPIYSQIEENEPYGALVCCRMYSGDSHQKGFSKYEQIHLQNICNQLAYGFDTTRWRDFAHSRLQRQLRLSHIWANGFSEEERLNLALQLLKEEGPFTRLLLSLVKPDQSSIVGKAVVDFRRDLIEDTNRTIHSVQPEDPKEEDILALVCRNKIHLPFEVSPFDDNDEFAKHVDRYTAERHDVTGKLVVIPMSSAKGEIVGVVLAEAPLEQKLSATQKESFAYYANHIANMIEISRAQAATEGRLDAIESFIRNFSNDLRSGQATTESVLLSCIQLFCRRYGFDKGLAYLYDEESGLLEGKVGHNVACPAVVTTTYTVHDNMGSAFNLDKSLALNVFHSKQARFVQSLANDPVDQEDREAVGLPSTDRSLAVPITLGGKVFAVVIVSGENSTNPLPSQDSEIQALSHSCAISIHSLLLQKQNRRLILHDSAESVFIHASSKIAGAADQIDRLPNVLKRNDSTVRIFLSEAAKFLGAQMCGLFVGSDVIELPSNDAMHSDVRKLIQEEKFVLHAGIGFPTNIVGSHAHAYSLKTKGLTSSVLRTLSLNSSPNVEDDDRWSGGIPDDMTGLRAWLGVPLLIEDKNTYFLYGVLTFARRRRHNKDTKEFSSYEMAVAERLAWLFSIGLHSQQNVRRLYQSIKSTLECSMHEIRQGLADINDSCDVIKNNDLQQAHSKECDAIESDLRFIRAALETFSDLSEGRTAWPKGETSLSKIRDTILRIAESKASSINFVIDAEGHFPLDESRILFITHCLVDNAIRACQYKSSSNEEDREVCVQLQASETSLVINVSDNGIGFDSKEETEAAKTYGWSGWKTRSSGLGLSIIARLVEGNGGETEILSESGKGTSVHITLNR